MVLIGCTDCLLNPTDEIIIERQDSGEAITPYCNLIAFDLNLAGVQSFTGPIKCFDDHPIRKRCCLLYTSDAADEV